jgi:hypothetical protein
MKAITAQGELSQAEVDDFRVSLDGDHDVVRLEVPMDDPCRMRFSQPLGGLGEDFQPPRHRRLPGQKLAQRLAVDEFHGDVVDLFRPLPRARRRDRLHCELGRACPMS